MLRAGTDDPKREYVLPPDGIKKNVASLRRSVKKKASHKGTAGGQYCISIEPNLKVRD
jgi:hypothetical protein